MTAFVVGLTGPMGAGKTTVAAMLRELGAKVLDADALVRDEQSRGTVGYSAIVQQFGTHVLGEDKEIDRAKLAAEVFGDPEKLAKLERIMHPRVVARVLQARAMLPDDAVMVVEAIKLLDGQVRRICDRIWVVLAPHELMLRRLEVKGMSQSAATLRLAQQRTAEEFRAAADVVIVNEGDLEATRDLVRRAWATLREPRRAPTG